MADGERYQGTGSVGDSARVDVSNSSIWRAIGAVLLTLLAIWLVLQARTLTSMVLMSFFFSLALQPGVNSLGRRYGWRRGVSVGVMYAGGAVFAIMMIVVMIPAIAEVASRIGESGGQWLDNINDWSSENLGIDLFTQQTARDVAAGMDEALAGWAANAFGTLLGFASSGIGFIFNMATVAMFTFYLTADAPRLQRAILSRFSEDSQDRIGWTWDEAITQTGGYFYSRAILMVINGFGFFFTMVLVGLPVSLSIPLALFGGFVSAFIPAIGTYIGAAVPILVTVAVQGVVPALIVLAYALAYQQVENFWLSPKISADTMTLNGGVAFGAALAGGAIAGPMGAFVALPVAALITSFMSHYGVHHDVAYQASRGEAQAPPTAT